MVVGAVMGCGGEPNAPPKPQQHAAHFAYAGDEGPSRWGSLDPAWALCASGTRQSPIELPESAPPDPAHAMGAQTYEPVPLHIANNGHTIQVNDGAASSLVIDGATYALAQFHFHVPAEHVVAGKHFDAEMHLVHKTHDGHVAVVALFVKSGQPNAALAAVIDHAPEATTTEDVVVPGASVDLQAMLPKAPTYLRYDGSLTVPPCTEGSDGVAGRSTGDGSSSRCLPIRSPSSAPRCHAPDEPPASASQWARRQYRPPLSVPRMP